MPAISMIVERYMTRHAARSNQVLHLVGVPATLAGVGLLLAGMYSTALILIASGFFVQYIGHRIEGSPMGELQLIRRLLPRHSE
jgi:putative flippase GtrA